MTGGSGPFWLTVPTHTSPPSLDLLVERAGMPVVVVHTAPSRNIEGALNVTDYGPPNIHRWWNTGLEEIERRGGEVAVVANHDAIPADAEQLPRLAAELSRTGATLARVARVDSPPDLTWSRRELTGWCFAINLTHGLRPNEAFRWWCGDDWLDCAARILHHGTVGVAVNVRHQRADGQLWPEGFRDLVDADRRLWRLEERRLLAGTHTATGTG